MKISGNNLRLAIKSLDITQEEAARKLGTTRQSLSSWLKYEILSDELLQNVKSKLGIDLEEQNVDIIKPDGIVTRNNTLIRKTSELIPFYNADFMAGRSEALYDDGSQHPDYYMDVPEFSGCVAFRAFGDSMEKLIKSSSVLFGLKLDVDWRNYLEYGQIYGITMKNHQRYLKYIRKSKDADKFLLKSENENYDDFEIPKEKIKNIWLIQGWIDKRA